jgi:hypothetical protein
MISVFPEIDAGPCEWVWVRLSELRLCRPRQWGACWLVVKLWRELELDRFWGERLSPSRKGTRWDQVLLVLVAYRLIAPGSEWRLHREWFGRTALADLLGADFRLTDRPSSMPVTIYCSSTTGVVRSFAKAGVICSMLASRCCSMI